MTPPVHLESNVCKQNKSSIYPSSQDVANSKPSKNTIVSNTVEFLPLVDSIITVQHPNNQTLQRTSSLVKRNTIRHQPIDQQLNKGYFRKRNRTRPPQIRYQQRNRYSGFDIPYNTIYRTGSNISGFSATSNCIGFEVPSPYNKQPITVPPTPTNSETNND